MGSLFTASRQHLCSAVAALIAPPPTDHETPCPDPCIMDIGYGTRTRLLTRHWTTRYIFTLQGSHSRPISPTATVSSGSKAVPQDDATHTGSAELLTGPVVLKCWLDPLCAACCSAVADCQGTGIGCCAEKWSRKLAALF